MPSTATTYYKGRSYYDPTEQDRKTVRAMTAYGINRNDICAVLGITNKTLRRHFPSELATASTEANAKIAQALFQKALNGDTVCMIFWLKIRAGWHERLIVRNEDANDVDPADLSDAELDARIARLSRAAVAHREAAEEDDPPLIN